MKNCDKLLTAALLLAAAMQAGCGSAKRTEQEIAYRQEGLALLEDGAYEDAADCFDMALAQHRGKPGGLEKDIYLYKAKAQIEAGDLQQAADTYTELLSEDKENADAYYLRGCAYISTGENEKAVSDFAQAVSCKDDSLFLYADIYERLSDAGLEEEAAPYLEQGLLVEGDAARERLLRGRLYLADGDYSHAIEELEHALAQGEDAANRYIANAYRMQGDYEKARAYYEAYCAVYPSDGDVLYEMGRLEAAAGNYKSALDYFEQGLADENAENRQGLWSGKIAAMEYCGDFAGAKTEMEAYMEQYPQDEEAAREYQFLKTR